MDITTKVTHRRVVIVGAGYVGASIAYALTITNLAREIILIDIDEEKAIGEALDIQHGIPYMGVSKVRSGSYADCSESDLIIVTAGRNRRVGETRLDMISDNIVIIKKGEIVEEGTPAYMKGKYTEDHMIAYGYDDALKADLENAGRSVEERNDELWIRVEGKEDVLGLIEKIKNRIEFFEVRMGTMDEMFINIVGEEGRNP